MNEDIARLLSTTDLSDNDISALRHMIDERQNPPLAVTPTSKLLSDAAKLISNLMLGRGVDTKNGWRWQDFVGELQERAAAFRQCEEQK